MLVGLGIETDKVDGARPAGSGTYMRQLLAEKGIDEARLSHIGATQEGKLRWPFRRKELRVTGGNQELGVNSSHFFLNLSRAKRGNPIVEVALGIEETCSNDVLQNYENSLWSASALNALTSSTTLRK